MIGGMNFLQKGDKQYFILFALFIFLIFDYSYPCPRNDVENDDNFDGKSTSFNSARNISKRYRVRRISSTVKPKRRLKLKTTRSPTARNTVVVFDIDDAIGINIGDLVHPHDLKNCTECPRIWWTYKESRNKYLFIFLPHLDILFNYLLEHGVRIVFFSGGVAERNLFIIPELLVSFFGRKRYKALKSKGQFCIYSREDLTSMEYGGIPFKDLRKIIRGKESLSDIILVDDDYNHCADDQKPFIVVRSLMTWNDEHDIVVNSIYYVLGLFKTYFENERFKELPIKDAMLQIFPAYRSSWSSHYHDPGESYIFERFFACGGHSFVGNMIDVGLSAVRAQVPNATLYQRQDKYFRNEKCFI